MRRFKAGIFHALGHPTRVALVEALLAGERSVGELCTAVGVEQANASQHLAVLRGKYVVAARKEGNQTFYRLRDPRLADVLATMRAYFFAHLAEATELLREEAKAARKAGRGGRK